MIALRPPRWHWVLLAAFLILLAGQSAHSQPYGLDAASPVGPYLDGAFPSTPPTAIFGWAVTDAFPNLAIANTSVIEPNAADGRLYVGSRDGQIQSFANTPLVSSAQPFMDLRDRVAVVNDGGFLGLVFHPDFGQAGSPYEFIFYAYYTAYCPVDAEGDDIDFSSCNPGYPTGDFSGFFNTWLRLSRFEAFFDAGAGHYRGDPASEEPMLSIRQMGGSHYGGGMVFDASGLLFLTIGDQVRYETAQDIVDTLEGGTLRVSVDITDNGDGTWSCPPATHLPIRVFPDISGNTDEVSGRLYCIPDDNPWLDAGGGQFEEYFSIGHRNPHRLAYDAVTDRLWSGEVGETSREEINVIEKGNNYGWPFREGLIAGVRPPPPSFLGVLTDPVMDFTRSEANALIGGYVYRGTQFPELVGRFLAGDHVTRNLWAVDLDEPTMTATAELLTTFSPGGLGTFGRDLNGEVFLGSVTTTVPLQELERVIAPGANNPPTLLSQVGAFDRMSTLDVHDAAVPYDLVPFWSDGAAKSRWLFLPNDGTHDQPEEQIGFSENGNWTFPTGTVLMKHFELPLDDANPQITTRLETRFMVHAEADEWYGVTYRWEPDQLDAVLLFDEETADYTIQTFGGGTRNQTWAFPSPSQCVICHSSEAGGALGPRTHQLNRDLSYPATGRTDNQLRTWNHLGMFQPAVNEAAIGSYLAGHQLDDATASVEDRARAWLDTNCSYCHRPETTNPAAFDTRLTTPFETQGLVWGSVADPLGIPDAFVIKPGDPLSSILFQRAAALGAIAMPPLSKNLVHDEGTALLWEWILRVKDVPRPGLVYEYYEELGLSALPDFDSLTPVTTGSVGSFDIAVRERDDDFAIRFTGFVEIPIDGTWIFYTSSDEGSQLFIDGSLVVDNDGLHPITQASGALFLTAGFHEIVVTVFERSGGQALTVSWEGPGVAQQLIPSGILFEDMPSAVPNQPPTLAQPSSQLDSVGDPVTFALSASDPDGDPLVYAAQNLPEGLILNSSLGVIQGTLGPASGGSHAVVVSVSDGPSIDSKTFSWNVNGGDTVDPSVSITAPSGGAILSSGTALLAASATDNVGIAGVQFLLDGLPLGNEDLVAPFETPWTTGAEANGAYTLAARARDAAGNIATSPEVAVTVDNSILNLAVAAWGFDEGSGSVAVDGTGQGHDGTVTGAQWITQGVFGGALEFDGIDDVVTVLDTGALDLSSGEMTLSAWVYPNQPLTGWRAILQKEANAYFLNANTSLGGPGGGGSLGGSCCDWLSAPSALPVGTWTHVAVTYDGAQLRHYLNGVEVASQPASGAILATSAPLRIGANEHPNESLPGRLDEVRVYDQALSPAQIQADMNTSTLPPVPDTEGPTVSISSPPDGATVSGVVSVTASASDNVGVVGVQFFLDGVLRGTEDVTVPYEFNWNTIFEANGPYMLSAQARDAAGNTALSTGVVVTVDNSSVPLAVAAWGFDEGSGSVAVDGTGQGHDGTVTGAQWITQGVFGGALEFDGIDDVVTVLDTGALDLSSGEMTLSAWVYPNQPLTGWRAILQKEANAYFLNANTSLGGPGGGGSLGGSCCDWLSAPSALPVGTWTHVAVTYDGAQLRHYLNGVEVASQPASGAILATSAPLRIGANEHPNESLPGRLDEVRVYDQVLSPAQIQSDMNTAVTVPGNGAPTITITSPQTGSQVPEGTPVNLAATATDAEDGDLSASIAWTSSLDGALGTGASVSRSDLSLGVHTISAFVTDSGGLSEGAQLTLTVASNLAPTVTILNPATGSQFTQGSQVNFTGAATDTEDGELTSTIVWASDLAGPLGTGGTLNTNALGLGQHIISASVTDSGGLPGNAQITITVTANGVPSVTISAPTEGTTVTLGDPVNFVGSATDPEDGDLSAALTWSSILDGPLGTGESLNTTALTLGAHIISANVSDAAGQPGSAQITLTVSANSPPSVTISSPLGGSTVNLDDPVDLIATASDPEDGDLSSVIAWSSDLDGALGSGGSMTRSDLSEGTHTLSADVADSGSLVGHAEVVLTVPEPRIVESLILGFALLLMLQRPGRRRSIANWRGASEKAFP